jgi:hypothetical protein
VIPPAPLARAGDPDLARVGRGALGRDCAVRGALEVTIGRSSIDCSLEQIGQFWIKRLCRQKLGMLAGAAVIGRIVVGAPRPASARHTQSRG